MRHIANGGMASVWEAHDELLDRRVAVKVLASHLGEDDRARRRFAREARTAAGLSSHPNVVTIYDVGEHDGQLVHRDGAAAGGTVADRLRAGEQIPHDVALRWLEDAGSALDAAHEAGIVHRDVKPANMLLDEQGRLALADFGIARLGLEDQITQTGQVLGTAAYISPEQAMGEPSTAASDRYALAVVAFELLTGDEAVPGRELRRPGARPRRGRAAARVRARPRPAARRRPRAGARHGQGARGALGDRRRDGAARSRTRSPRRRRAAPRPPRRDRRRDARDGRHRAARAAGPHRVDLRRAPSRLRARARSSRSRRCCWSPPARSRS